MTKRETLRGAGSVYIENLVFLGAGYVYWFVMAKVTTAEVIGTASTLISVIVILSVIASIGIPSGLQRFIGRTYLNGKLADTRIYVLVSLVLMIVGIIFSTFVLFFAHQWILDTPVEPNLLLISIILIWSTSLMSLFRSVIISSLSKSTILPIVASFSTIVKIVAGISLVILGLGALGVMIGFTLAPVIISVILAYVAIKLLKSTASKREVRLKDCFKDLVWASIPSWVPLIINTIGSHLGTIVVYGAHGAEQAGVYYISLSMVIALITVMSALYTVSYPVLSAMKDGRKRLAWRSIKMTLVLSSPISLAFLFYSHEIISIFGQDYERGAGTLQILLLSIFPSLVAMGVSALVYANGKYRDVLVIGLASNVPRPLLYVLLVPIFDTTGAALSYTIGSIIGLLFSLEISRRNGLHLFWKEIIIMLLIPGLLSIAFKLIKINFIAGILSIIIISTLIYLRFKILNEEDIKDSLLTLPDRISSPLISILLTITKKNNK